MKNNITHKYMIANYANELDRRARKAIVRKSIKRATKRKVNNKLNKELPSTFQELEDEFILTQLSILQIEDELKLHYYE